MLENIVAISLIVLLAIGFCELMGDIRRFDEDE